MKEKDWQQLINERHFSGNTKNERKRKIKFYLENLKEPPVNPIVFNKMNGKDKDDKVFENTLTLDGVITKMEKMENSIERCKGPVARAQYYRSKNTIFKNKRDFYEKVWLDEDFEKFDKVNSINGQMINYLCDLT